MLIRILIQDVKKFVTGLDPGKNETDPDPAKKDKVPGKSLKFDMKKCSYPMFSVCILLNNHFSIKNHLN